MGRSLLGRAAVLLAGAAGTALLLLAVAPAASPAPEGPSFERDVRPLLAASCVRCHSGIEPAGKLAMTGWTTEAAAKGAPAALRSVRTRLIAGDMPPKDQPRPAKEAITRALAWLEAALNSPAAGASPRAPTPGV